MKNKNTAGILALFFGGLGVHKFYLDRPIQGLLYLVFCWTFVPMVIAFIEAIIYFTSDDRSFNAKYNINYNYGLHLNTQINTQQTAVAPSYSESDKEFMGKMFFKFENEEYNNTSAYHNMVMDMICHFMDFMNTLNNDYKVKFFEREKIINEMNTDLNDPKKNYWEILLKEYKKNII